jgi:hypothetical protein
MAIALRLVGVRQMAMIVLAMLLIIAQYQCQRCEVYLPTSVLTVAGKDGDGKITIGPDTAIWIARAARITDSKVGSAITMTGVKREDGSSQVLRATISPAASRYRHLARAVDCLPWRFSPATMSSSNIDRDHRALPAQVREGIT